MNQQRTFAGEGARATLVQRFPKGSSETDGRRAVRACHRDSELI
jgi:hypothetical protein